MTTNATAPNETTIRTLRIVASNPGYLTSDGHAILNAGIRDALENGWIRYAPRRRISYALTDEGAAALKLSKA